MIRAAIKDDAPAIAELFYKSMPSPWKQADIEGALSAPSMVTWVLEDEGLVQSAIILQACLDEAEILSIATSPTARRKGHARKLLSYALSELGTDVNVFLEVRSKNSGAISFYEALGFEPFGLRKGYYKSPPDDALLMKLAKI